MMTAPQPPRRASDLRIRFGLAVLAIVLGACACQESAAPPAPPQIQTVQVIQRDQPIILEMVGQTRGSADIPIRARVEGVVIGMHFTEGRKVEKDALLYTIDPDPFESLVVEAKGYLAEAQTMLAKAKADLDRIRPLAEMRAVSQTDLDSAVAQHDAAVASVQAAAARVEQAEIQRGYTEIASPIDGFIGISAAKVGEFVGKSPNPVVLNFVSQTDPIRVRFSIDERRFLMITQKRRDLQRANKPIERTGNLELVLADGSIHEHHGAIVAADAAINPETGTFTLEADFSNPDALVLAGQFARVRAAVETRENALLVPQRCISELQGLFRVYVVGDDGTVELRNVELGAKVDRLQIVESGLRAGERVALDVMRLRPGMTVAAVPTELDASGAVRRQPGASAAAPGSTEP
jgi:membrane fusion protein (multidrug efflux system)